jgi:hypothetical protein
MPSTEPVVSEEDFRAWVTRLRPCVCVVQADARTISPEENTHRLDSLQRLLKNKPTARLHSRTLSPFLVLIQLLQYALAAWNSPSGVKENMLLISSFGNNGIIGAFFPNGIKEMPRTVAPQYSAQQLLQLQQLRNQAQARAGYQFANPAQAAAVAAAAIASRPPIGGQPPPNAAWMAGLANMSPEMVKSFMARKGADGGNPGGGM